MKNLRTFEIKYLGATNHKGSRVRIKDLRFGKTKIIPLDYSCRDSLEAAYKYLSAKLGIDVQFQSEGEKVNYLHTDNFKTGL